MSQYNQRVDRSQSATCDKCPLLDEADRLSENMEHRRET